MPTSSGIAFLGELHAGAHVGQFYRDRHDLLETLVPYFATGLRQHERCIWVTAEPLSAAEARTALADVVSDLDVLERSGQIEILEHDQWYLRNGTLTPEQVIHAWIAAEEAALADGYSGLRISGNTFWLPADQWTAFSEYEARVHSAFAGRKIIALCSYSLSRCGANEVVDVLRNHSISIVRAASGWEVVQGATAALASLEPETERIRQVSSHSVELYVSPSACEVDRVRAELAQVTAALAKEMGRRQVAEAAYANATNAREHLILLHRLTASLGEVTTRAQVAEVVHDLLLGALEAQGIAVIERRDTGELLTMVAEGLAASALQAIEPSERAIYSNNVTRLVGAPRELRAFASIPMTVGARPLGTLVLGYDSARDFSASYRALVEDSARQLTLAFERAASYERVEHERERAELASRAKDEFLAMLGHELRNPLSPILTATQLMRLRGEEVFSKERTVIERQVKHMMRLVDDLLDVSRITRGKVDLRRRSIEIAEVVAQAVELASPAMEERAHRFTLDVPAHGVVVNADAARLAQVISNLLTNAAKYTPPRGEIHLSVRAGERDVILTVRDNGSGIDPLLAPNIFDLFVQGRQGIDRANGGLGLGLAIAKTIVTLHGGTISVHSDGPGHGSEFVVDLPRFANTRPVARSNNSGAFPLPMARARRVLVVDDNEDAAFLFSDALRRLGHHVAVAHDGPSALAVARESPPEIAFLDIGLPVMDGYELGRRLRELGGASPRLVAVTGYGNTSDRERSRDAGFDLHLVKPIEISVVRDAIAKLDR